jgi:hypothetical protein
MLSTWSLVLPWGNASNSAEALVYKYINSEPRAAEITLRAPGFCGVDRRGDRDWP